MENNTSKWRDQNRNMDVSQALPFTGSVNLSGYISSEITTIPAILKIVTSYKRPN
jgi:hypothetical protein